MEEIREARIEDCLFVARGICMALHSEMEEPVLQQIAKICEREDVLYSYRHALIAWEGEIPVGLCLCYDGGRYHEMRKTTFPLFDAILGGNEDHDQMDLDHAEDEALAGEYYIDSLAVMPDYRRRGIAYRLMQAQMAKARKLGFHKATLLVDPANPNAQQLYKRLGFVEDAQVYAFGQIFWKWQLPLALDDYEVFRQAQMAQFEEDIEDGRCFPEMPEGLFVRSK